MTQNSGSMNKALKSQVRRIYEFFKGKRSSATIANDLIEAIICNLMLHFLTLKQEIYPKISEKMFESQNDANGAYKATRRKFGA